MKNLFLLAIVALLGFAVTTNSNAQTLNTSNLLSNNINANALLKNLKPTAIGVRFDVGSMGLSPGLTVQQDLSKNTTIEALITVNAKDLRLTGLYEYYQPLPFYKNYKLRGFVGAGAHVAKKHSASTISLLQDIMSTSGSNNLNNLNVSADQMRFGLDAIAGVQWKPSRKMPINMSLDVKPAVTMDSNMSNMNFEIGAAFSVRWLLGGGGGSGSGSGKGSGSGSGGSGGNGKVNNGSASGTSTGGTKGGPVKVKKHDSKSTNNGSNNGGGGSSTTNGSNNNSNSNPKSRPSSGNNGSNSGNSNGNNGGSSGGNSNGEGWGGGGGQP